MSDRNHLSDPLLGHDDRADHGHQQQDRSNFKRQHVGVEQNRTRPARCSAPAPAPDAGVNRVQTRAGSPPEPQTPRAPSTSASSSATSHCRLNCIWCSATSRFTSMITKTNSTMMPPAYKITCTINRNSACSDKKNPRRGQQCSHQKNGALHRVAARHHQDARRPPPAPRKNRRPPDQASAGPSPSSPYAPHGSCCSPDLNQPTPPPPA